MTEPSKTEQDFSPVEQKLRGKIAELFEDARQEGVILKWADGFTDAGQVLDLIRETFSELAKERGYKSPEEVVEFIVSHKRSYYARPDGTIILVTSAEWTEQEWESLTKGVAL